MLHRPATPSTRRPFGPVMAAALLLAATAGCQAVGGDAEPVRELEPAELHVLDRAEAVLTASCMRRRGFRHEPPELASRLDPSPGAYPFGLDDLTYARRHGYGIVEGAAEEGRLRRTDPNRKYVSSLPADRRTAYNKTLTGDQSDVLRVRLPTGPELLIPRDGCLAEAQRELYGDFDRWSRAKAVVDNLRSEIDPAVGENARYQKALRRWSACMRSKGHSYAGPGPIRREIAEAIAAPGADRLKTQARETTLAVAEAECARGTGLVRTARDLERVAESRIRQRRQADIETVQAARLSALPLARSLVNQD